LGDVVALREILDGTSGLAMSKPDLSSRDFQGKTALMLAVTSGSKAAVEFLLLKRANLSEVDNTRKSVLHHATKRAKARRTAQALVSADQAAVVELLLRGRAGLEARDDNSCTPLMLAVATGDQAVAQALLDAGADPRAEDQEGQTSLDYAVSFEHVGMAQLLAKAEEDRKRGPAINAVARAAEVGTVSAAPQAAPTINTRVPMPVGPEPGACEDSPSEVVDMGPEMGESAGDAKPKRSKGDKGGKGARGDVPRRADELDGVERPSGELDKPASNEAAGAPNDDDKAEKAERRRRKHREAGPTEGEGPAVQEAAPPPEPEIDERQQAVTRLQALMSTGPASLGEAEADDFVRELKAAVKAAQAAGVEERECQGAEACLKDLKARGKAQERLRQAIVDRDLEKLHKAIAKAEEAKAPKSLIDEARAVLAVEGPKQKAREHLCAAREGGDVDKLKSAIKAARKAGLDDAELADSEGLLAQLELRVKAEAGLRTAMESRQVDALRSAIEAAAETGVDASRVKEAELVLREEEPKQKARALLIQACEQCDIPALKEALDAAKAANLDASEYSRAAELLRQEEDKLLRLEAVNKTMDAVKTVDMSSIDALREAKESLGVAIQQANKAGVAESSLLEAERRRKKLHNAIEDLKGSIRVFCRIRPLSSKEKEQGDTQITESKSSMSLAVEGNSTFHFDAVFTPGSQEEIFEDCRDLVQSAIDGYNVTMFAYGQTGAGKTFTMYGTPGMEGTAPRTIQEVYKLVDEGKSRFDFEITGSMLELYCNDLVDLLSKGQVGAGKSKLNIRSEKSGAVVVENLAQEVCGSAEELSALLERGNQQRTVKSTAMNSESSRSHLVLIIKITSVNKATKEQLKGKILICDLAGSERLKKSQVEEEGQKEAIEINKSLTALGDVIEALTKAQKNIPYRNHKLTQLMQDSLGGTSKTLMFVNCSPANSNIDETLMSLKYATRAKKITNTTKKAT